MAFFPNPLFFKDEVYAITGAAMEVPNTLGNGLNEKVYENALVVECRLRKIPFDQQPRFPVDYKGCRVGEFIPDLILHGKIIVDTKTIDHITDVELSQMLNYLRVTGLTLGLIVNFKHARLEVRRVVLEMGLTANERE
jgi:GxxExxY protein